MYVSKEKKPAVPAGSGSTTSGSGTRASQRSFIQLAGKREANERGRPGDSKEPANRRAAPGVGSAPLPTIPLVTGEQAAVGRRQLELSEGGVIYAAVFSAPVVPLQPSDSLKPTAMDLDLSERGFSSETTNSHMSSDMSAPMCDKPDGTTHHAHLANNCLPGELLNNVPIFISGVGVTWLVCGQPALGSDSPTKWREVDGRPIKSRDVHSCCHCTAVP